MTTSTAGRPGVDCQVATEPGTAIRSLPGHVADLARREPNRVLLTAYDRTGEVAQTLTTAQLDAGCRVLAGALLKVASPGDRVLVPAMPGLRFHLSFLACLYAECVAVPVPAIRGAGVHRNKPGATRRLGRLLGVCSDCGPVAAFAPTEQLAAISTLAAGVPELASVSFLGADAELDTPVGAAGAQALPEPAEFVPAGRLAFLQYTSGSTSAPRGVMISHGALMANQQLIHEQLDIRSTTTVVSWLPLYHDMGLCAGLLQPVFAGASVRLMEPETFLLRPERWLTALSGLPDAVTAAPDFAYALAVSRIPQQVRERLDLSGWRVALCGAEPVRASTMGAFADAFAVSGFNPVALTPAYGLAESTLYVSGAASSTPPTVRRYDRAALGRGSARACDRPDAVDLVAVGVPAEQVAVVIVDSANGQALPPGGVGEVWVSSASNGSGYWGRPEEAATTFRATLRDDPRRRWLRTGDLGFLDNGELFVAGRLKELIIIRGVNYFPHDFERLAQAAHPLLRSGLAAAFTDPAQPDRVLVVIESDRCAGPDELSRAAAAALYGITDQLPVQTEVIMIGAIQIPRTTSGKVRRGDCARRFVAGELTVLATSSGHAQ